MVLGLLLMFCPNYTKRTKNSPELQFNPNQGKSLVERARVKSYFGFGPGQRIGGLHALGGGKCVTT